MTQWKTVPFDNAFKDITSKGNKIPQDSYQRFGKYPIIDQGESFIAGYLDDESLAWNENLPVVIFGDHTRILKFVDFRFVLGADGTKVLKPSKDLIPKFAYYNLLHLDIPSAGYSRHFRFLKESEISFPLFDEQKRIAAILDKADRLRRQRRFAQTLADSFLQSVFIKMFGNPVSNPMNWEKVKLNSLGDLDRGHSKHRPRNASHLYGGIYPFVQTGDIANSTGYIKTFRQTYSEEGLKQSKLWKSGTLCITIAANIAKTAILTFDACFPDSVVGFTPNQKTNVNYIQQWFSFVQRNLEETAPESAQKNINLEILRGLEIIAPPLPLQEKFAELVQKFERVRRQQREATRQAEHLFQTLLHRAFRGQL